MCFTAATCFSTVGREGEKSVRSIRIWNSNICPLTPPLTHPDNYLHFGRSKCELITSVWKLSAPSLGQLKVIIVILIALIWQIFSFSTAWPKQEEGKKKSSFWLPLTWGAAALMTYQSQNHEYMDCKIEASVITFIFPSFFFRLQASVSPCS